jgi:uncharacterized delta-60 repeat protein
MLRTKQTLNSNKFTQTTGDTLSLNGTTYLEKYSGSSIDFKVNNGFRINNSLIVIGEGFKNATLNRIIRLNDNSLFVGGNNITSYNGNNTVGAYVKLSNSNLSLNSSFVYRKYISWLINDIAQQVDGNIIIVGNGLMSIIDENNNGQGICRLTSNGNIDTSFKCGEGFDSTAHVVVIQQDGKILVGGSFNTYNEVSANGLVRLNTDGTIDNTFNIGTGFVSLTSLDLVYSLCIQSDGKIVVVGDFDEFNGTATSKIVRLNSDGTIDTSFDTTLGGFDGGCLAVCEIGSNILVGGNFLTYNGSTAYGVALISQIDGSLLNGYDTEFGEGDLGYKFLKLSSGKILAAGSFYNQLFSGKCILRFNVDGTIDETFKSSSDFVNDISELSNGDIVAVGGFTSFDNIPNNGIVILSSNGEEVKSASSSSYFKSIFTYTTNPSASNIQDNSVITKSYLDTYFTFTNGLEKDSNQGVRLGGNITRNTFIDGRNLTLNIGQIKLTNTLDQGIELHSSYHTDSTIRSIDITPEGILYSVGNNSSINKYNIDGTIDDSFNRNISTALSGLFSNTKILYETGSQKLYMIGNFTSYQSHAIPRILKIDALGNLDTAFNYGSGISGTPQDMIFSGNSLIIVGAITSYQGSSASGIFKINLNGTRDTTFATGTFVGNSTCVAMQADGKIIVGGQFTQYAGNSRNRIVRINRNGSIDTSFVIGTGFNSNVNALKIQSDGKIIVGGQFTTYSGVTANGIVRLNSNGTRDNTFINGSGFSSPSVLAIELDSSGKIYVSGSFDSYSGTSTGSLVRLNSNGSLDQTFKNITDSDVRVLRYSNDKLYAGGNLTVVYGKPFSGIAIFSSGGTHLNSYTANTLTNALIVKNTHVRYNLDTTQSFTSMSVPHVGFVTGLSKVYGFSGATTVPAKFGTYVLSGSSALSRTFTLPSIGNSKNIYYRFKNRSNGNLVIQGASVNQIFDTGVVDNITLFPGDAIHLQNDGTYWITM